jgi:hypothetical protein
MVSKRLLALAAAGTVAAQSSSSTCTFSQTQTIDSPSATSVLSRCDVVDGSISITSSGTVDISGPTRITGDLVAENNANLTSLTSSTLESIEGKFSLAGVTSLASLSMSALTSVNELSFVTCPLLQSMGLSSPGITRANKVTLEDTFIQNLDNFAPTEIDTFSVNINKRLTEINMPFRTASSQIQMSANGQSVSASFPNLVWAASMIIQNVTTFSAPSLVKVNNSLQFDSNYFTEVSCANLTETGNALSLIGNSNVQNVSFPVLTKVGGGLDLLNNTVLEQIDGFPALEEVDGAITIKGIYTDVSLPRINVVQGTSVFSSSGDISDSCRTFESSDMNNVWGGKLTCMSNNTASATDSSTTSTAGSGSSSSDDENAAAGLSLHMGLLGVVAMGVLANVL